VKNRDGGSILCRSNDPCGANAHADGLAIQVSMAFILTPGMTIVSLVVGLLKAQRYYNDWSNLVVQDRNYV
jgi:hypothetical protein